MNKNLLHTKVQNFLKTNEHQSASTIALKGSPFTNVTTQELAQQLSGKQKAKYKLPTWYASDAVMYPPLLNLEQTSSEKTAFYKSTLVSGDTLVDATGGFGIDSYYFSKKMTSVIHCELNKALQKIAAHNLDQLGAKNITSINANGVETALAQTKLDWLYIDPSRRSDTKGKVFFLEDCLPNVAEIQDNCFEVTNHILVKTAPILDIAVGLKSLKFVKQIHIVAVHNEVKELLWVMSKDFIGEPEVVACNMLKSGDKVCVNFPLSAEKKALARFNEVQEYLYEPYAVVMKTGAFNWISEHYKVNKLQTNSHLYTSENMVNFPGRGFKVISVMNYNKKIMKVFVGQKVNVVSRNFKETVAQLRKKYKLKEGTERYLFFTTDVNNNQIVIDCLKIVLSK
ncbi:THUMP-like domain-containing protein [Aquimarina agarilytica]|uniref:THUMP-like domain-containing protein n=1 Tax=Aquimarina agarilytica TaxID=1087449 RepID=UPI00028A3C78|nr:hypothetical protein [Aquimarina agarilytica]